MYVCWSIFLHSSHGHFGYFHVLTFVNNAVMNMEVWLSLWHGDFTSFGCIIRSGIAESYGSFIFVFFEESQLFSIVLYWFIFPPQLHKPSPFPHSNQHLSFYFYRSHSKRYEVISRWGFDLHFPDQSCWVSFHVFVGHVHVFVGKMSI